ncbi:MAG: hypothetical protein Kow0092_36460 [Deferrisomatales bacterium]
MGQKGGKQRTGKTGARERRVTLSWTDWEGVDSHLARTAERVLVMRRTQSRLERLFRK